MIRLRAARRADSARLRAWRNAASTRRWFVDPRPVSREAHERWLEGVLRDRTRRLWIIERAGRPAGQIRLDFKKGRAADVSVTVSPGMRGKGVGAAALALAARRARRLGLRRLDALVFAANAASAAAFAKAGFGPGRRVKARGKSARLMDLPL